MQYGGLLGGAGGGGRIGTVVVLVGTGIVGGLGGTLTWGVVGAGGAGVTFSSGQVVIVAVT